MAAWADAVQATAPRLQQILASGEVYTAVRHAFSSPDGQARTYETVLDAYRFVGNPLLRNPREASADVRAKLEAAFPIDLHADDPLKGRAEAFANQLERHGNPWR